MSRRELKKVHDERRLKEARRDLKRAKEELKRAKENFEKNRKVRHTEDEEVKNILPVPANKKVANKEPVTVSAFPFLDKLGFFHFI